MQAQGIMGISNIHAVVIDGIFYGPEKAKKSKELSEQELRDLIDLELEQR